MKRQKYNSFRTIAEDQLHVMGKYAILAIVCLALFSALITLTPLGVVFLILYVAFGYKDKADVIEAYIDVFEQYIKPILEKFYELMVELSE